eukprot:m.34656 g.34656  ORF g.34656 m.34656 type:complete len:481 (+) comp17012_c0_seq2:147-1589(+)
MSSMMKATIRIGLMVSMVQDCLGVLIKPQLPLRGWNSYDSASEAANETILLATADVMSEKLASSGYVYLTVDAGWFTPATGSNEMTVDQYGRLLPVVDKFPSAIGGAGFGPLVDKMHAKGLKFGIWYMAGIPAATLKANSPIKGTNYTVADIAEAGVPYCKRWAQNWGVEVNHDHPGTKFWYKSLVEQWAGWGIDFVKLDCVNAEDEAFQHRLDILELSAAMSASDNAFVFSLSPGGFSNISQTLAIRDAVSVARVTDDFWDNWTMYMDSGGGKGNLSGASHWDAARDMIATARNTAPTFFPDLDMLPFGRIGNPSCNRTVAVGPGCFRITKYTQTEQQSIFALWTLAQSPLVLGTDLTSIDTWTLDLVTHPSVIAMAGDISESFEAFRTSDGQNNPKQVVWQAQSKESPTKHYLGVFNRQNKTCDAEDCALPWENFVGLAPTTTSILTDLYTGKSVEINQDNLKTPLEAHGVRLMVLVM